MRANDYYDMEELEWWRTFRAKCHNDIPVLRPLLGDRFKIMVQNPFDDTWEDVWQPAAQRQHTSDTVADATSV